MGVWLWHWNQSSQRQVLTNIKVLLTVFFDCNGVSIMNSCHKVIGSIRNTTLKLGADCAKQFLRNAQNCGKKSWILNHDNAPAHRFTGLGPAEFFLFRQLKTPTKAFCYDWGDKRKIETGAICDTKKCVSEVFRGLEKILA